jgi:hypothetical protein
MHQPDIASFGSTPLIPPNPTPPPPQPPPHLIDPMLTFEGRSKKKKKAKPPCPPGQDFSAFGFISFLMIGINLSANVISNLNANSNANENNNNNNNDNNNNNNLVIEHQIRQWTLILIILNN